LLTITFAQAQTIKADTATPELNLKSSAQKMGQLFIEKNYSQYVKYVHPKILKIFGGQDKMIEGLKKSLKRMEEEGFTINNVTIGEPSKIISTNPELQSVVPQLLELKTKDGRLVSTSYLIAISKDKGKTWYFIDTGGKTFEQLKSVFPSLNNKLVIPEKTQPVFYKD